MTTLIEAIPPLFALGPRSQAMARSEMTTLNSSIGITRRTDPSFCRYDFVTPCAEAVRLFLRELGPGRFRAWGTWGALPGPPSKSMWLGCLQVALGLQRGHASGPGRRHRLTVREVLHVTRGEHTGHAGLRGPGLHLDVAVRQQLDLAPEDLGVRLMADRDEEAVDRALMERLGLDVLQAHGRDLALVHVEDVVHRGVPDELDLRVLEGALLHDLRAAKRVAPVDDVHPAAQAREVECLLERGVAAAHDHDVHGLEAEADAGRAGG